MQGLKSVRKIVYAKVHRWSKDCLSRETNAVFPTLRSRTNSFRNDSSKKKNISSFGMKTARWMSCFCLCRNHLLWAFAAGILWKTQPLDIFARLPTAKYIELQTWCLFGRWLLCSVLWFEISYPHITSHVPFAKAYKYLRTKGLHKFLFHEISWKNIHFCGLKKENLIFDGRKI